MVAYFRSGPCCKNAADRAMAGLRHMQFFRDTVDQASAVWSWPHAQQLPAHSGCASSPLPVVFLR